MTNNNYINQAHRAIQQSRMNIQSLLYERRNTGVFDGDILDEEEETRESFRQRSDESLLIRKNDIIWVENRSVGRFTLTDQRIFYQPEFYDLPMTTKNLEIDLNHISRIGHWTVKGISGIVLFVGNANAKIEFTSKIPFNMIKIWKALKPINQNWKQLNNHQIDKMQQNGTFKASSIIAGVAAGGMGVAGGALLSAFLRKK